MKALNICPCLLEKGYEGYSPIARGRLFDGRKASPQLDFKVEADAAEATVGHYASGVYAATAKKGRIRLCRLGEPQRLLLQPAQGEAPNEATDEPWQTSEALAFYNEHLTTLIAHECYGLHVTPMGMAFDCDDRPALISRNPYCDMDGTEYAIAQPLAFSLRPTLKQAADAVRAVAPAADIAVERLFLQFLFTYIFVCDNRTPADIRLIARTHGDYQIAPLWRVSNMALTATPTQPLACFATDLPQKNVVDYFRTEGEAMGLKPVRIERAIKRFAQMPDKVFDLIDQSFLTGDMKSAYKSAIADRQEAFNGCRPAIETVTKEPEAPTAEAVEAEPAKVAAEPTITYGTLFDF